MQLISTSLSHSESLSFFDCFDSFGFNHVLSHLLVQSEYLAFAVSPSSICFSHLINLHSSVHSIPLHSTPLHSTPLHSIPCSQLPVACSSTCQPHISSFLGTFCLIFYSKLPHKHGTLDILEIFAREDYLFGISSSNLDFGRRWRRSCSL
jgi:hypothetical protein